MDSLCRFVVCGLLYRLIAIVCLLTSFNECGSAEGMSGSAQIEDTSDVTWAHAVNSRDELEKALASSVDFLEADISLGHVKGSEDTPLIPVMAHPPSKTSDISLDTWLETVATRGSEKGLKLDFKSIEVVEPSLKILQKYASKLNASVWLNADVLSGPVNSPTPPVKVEHFLTECHLYFPKAILSIGWTTYWFPTITTPETWHYEWKHVRKMVDVIRCSVSENNYSKFTFPVRGIFASRSIKLLQWLLRSIPGSSLTVWSHKFDPLELKDLLRIRSSFPKNKVYYDVPETIHKEFQAQKNSVDVPSSELAVDSNEWITLTHGHGDSCSTLTYVSSDIIAFGRSLPTAVLMKNLLVLGKNQNLKITGRIKFFDITDGPNSYSSSTQELMLVLADVSLFTKNESYSSQNELDLTTSDTEVIWSAIDSSIIFNFQHQYSQEETSCRVFKLDTSEDKSFEVWTVPCDTMLEESSIEDIAKSGVPEISSRKRLVLPEGPFMFGLVSKGEEHVVVHDLMINGLKTNSISGSSSSIKTSVGLFAALLSILYGLLIFL